MMPGSLSIVRRPSELLIPHSSPEHLSRCELITFQAKDVRKICHLLHLPKFRTSLFFLLLSCKLAYKISWFCEMFL